MPESNMFENKIVILDTNVWLLLYDLFTDSADTALECLSKIEDSLYVPSMVYEEFNRHHSERYHGRKNVLNKPKIDTQNLVEQQKRKAINSLSALVRQKCPDAEKLLEQISDDYDSIGDDIENYYDEHNILELVSDYWETDKPYELMQELKNSGHIMLSLSMSDILKIEAEGEARYKKKTPPGYMDAKDKTGTCIYGDLIIWKETLRFAKEQKKDVIFITEDVKEDWWSKTDTGLVFRKELIEEFEKETSQQIIPMRSNDLLFEIAQSFQIHMEDAVEIASVMTMEAYAYDLEDKVFWEIAHKLKYSELDYVEEDSMTYIGDGGIGEWEIDTCQFIDADYLSFEDGEVTYRFNYDVTMSGSSQDYWGHDDEENEDIYSDPYHHEVQGSVSIIVKRKVSTETDYTDDMEFASAELENAEFAESSYRSWSQEENSDDESYYDTCPKCGHGINHANDGGNGFCINCSDED